MRDEKPGEHPLDQDSYDWEEAFGYAGEPDTCATSYQGGPDLRRADPQDTTTPLTTFARADVDEVEAWSEGENDGAEWLCLGKLKDGRWFLLAAGCDYTGWDCQASGTTTLAPDRETLVAHGVTDEQVGRLGLTPPAAPQHPVFYRLRCDSCGDVVETSMAGPGDVCGRDLAYGDDVQSCPGTLEEVRDDG